MRDHTKLRTFESADRLVLEVYRATRQFPRDEQFGLTAQVRRACVSIASNIVEGCARRTEADYLHFLDMAYASSREAQYQLSLAFRLGYLIQADYDALRQVSEQTSKLLGALTKALRQQTPGEARAHSTDAS